MANKYTASALILVAQAELGYLEKSKSAYNKNKAVLDSKTDGAGEDNYCKYWRDVDNSFQGQYWCDCFVKYCFIIAFGATKARELLCHNKTGSWSFYTPTSAQYYKDKKQWYTSNPKPGDQIFFKNSTRINHTGIVYKVSSDNSIVYTIEGNTSNSESKVVANGGAVCAKSYPISSSSIAGYGRPKYELETGSTKSSPIVEIPITMSRCGLTVVGAASLNVRKAPVNGSVVKTIPQGTIVQATAKTKGSDGNYWFKIGTNQWISGKYIQGWIKETCGKWWYVKKDYKYDTLVVEQIDGEYFAFDKDGWLITSDRITSSGAIR